MGDDKDPADSLADQIRTHEAKITENGQAIDRLVSMMNTLRDEIRLIRRQLPAPRKLQ